uniref:Uncharacterized protein n=1 Tax=Triticum urartu TaxID=4572 RepID=A0A8R7TJ71_TRIUA
MLVWAAVSCLVRQIAIVLFTSAAACVLLVVVFNRCFAIRGYSFCFASLSDN